MSELPDDDAAAPKLAEQTAAKIELAIAARGWPLGAVIGSESDLLAEYGVSRAVLREAVRLLEHDNVARMRRGPGGGLVVAVPDTLAVTRASDRFLRYRNATPQQLADVRIAVELAAVRSAAENIDEAGIGLLRAVLDEEAAAGRQPDIASHQFHIVVGRLSGSPAAELFTEVLARLTAARLDSAGRAVQELAPPGVLAAHEAIAEAIIAGDVGLAQHRASRHLQAVADAVSRGAAAKPPSQRPRRRQR